MPTIMLRGLDAALVAEIRAHGVALGVPAAPPHETPSDRDCVLALVAYAIDQRRKRSAGAAATNAGRSKAEHSAASRRGAEARWTKARASTHQAAGHTNATRG